MAKKKKSTKDDEVIVDVTQRLTNAERFFEENRKSITLIIAALFVIVGGYFAYLYLYLQPLEEEAQREMFRAQLYFEQDSLRLALEGDGANYGFLDIAEEYAGTKAANLSHYYAGICYLNRGQFAEAIPYLDEFDSNDPVYKVVALGGIGDAFWELGQPKEAMEYYKKAVRGEENAAVVPEYLMRAGLVAEEQGLWKDALKFYQRIKKEFGESQQAEQIAKYIARVETQMES